MRETWSAAGLIESLWQRLPRSDGKPGKGRRDDLAAATGIAGSDLSAFNTGGRRINIKNAQKIADACGVTLTELGYQRQRTVNERLDALEERLSRLAEAVANAFVERETASDSRREQDVLLAVADEIVSGTQPIETPTDASQRHTGDQKR